MSGGLNMIFLPHEGIRAVAGEGIRAVAGDSCGSGGFVRSMSLS